MELEILTCKRCGAPLVLGDRDRVACPSCGTENDVPVPYRELYRARLTDATTRAEAERVLRGLDRPPRQIVKVLARIFDQPLFVFFLLFGVPVGLAAIFFALAANAQIARVFGYADPDDVPFGVTIAFAFAVLFVTALVPRALGIFANRRATGRQRLLAALAAHPPSTPGGPATCRRCGAPLAVVPDELVAVCAYCRAENAVHLETRLVVATTDAVKQLADTVRDVAERDREARHDTRRQLWRTTRRYAITTAIFGTGFTLSAQSDPEGEPTTVAVIALVGTAAFTIISILRSVAAHDDAHDRVEGNDVPQWIGVLGPIGVCILLYYAMRWI